MYENPNYYLHRNKVDKFYKIGQFRDNIFILIQIKIFTPKMTNPNELKLIT